MYIKPMSHKGYARFIFKIFHYYLSIFNLYILDVILSDPTTLTIPPMQYMYLGPVFV
jgi:hypothetical protein